MVHKAVPVVLRRIGDRIEILMFRHPLAGIQVVKGTVEGGEPPDSAALRELREESGIAGAGIAEPIGRSTDIVSGECCHFYRCRIRDLPDHWSHYAHDGGGLDFEFFWQPLDVVPSNRCDPIFVRALCFIRNAISMNTLDAAPP